MCEMCFTELVYNLNQWAKDKKIDGKECRIPQIKKIREEVTEYEQEVISDDGTNRDDTILELGDIGVTWVLACLQNGVRPQDALNEAWLKIRNRTGKTINGTFVKD